MGKNKREENSVFRERFRYNKQRKGIGMSDVSSSWEQTKL